jgi:serine/threonine-protein kinase PRP4
VRKFAKQLLTALRHLKQCGIFHADIKPDNILVDETMSYVKICDLGSAVGFEEKVVITPYLQSRVYRAPEIMLGLPYSAPADIWSIGCCLYEMYTGSIIFKGTNNNDMLRHLQEIKGPFPAKKLKKGEFVPQHFTKDLLFKLHEVDKYTKAVLVTPTRILKPSRDLHKMLKAHSSQDGKGPDLEKIKLAQLADLLEKIFILDPDKRLTVEQALYHPFIRDDPQKVPSYTPET